jgi:serine/threonine protein kinase
MSVSTTPCPATEILEGIAAGQAAPPTIAEHLTLCDACRQALQQMRDDNRLLREFAVDGSFPRIPLARLAREVEIPGYDITREIHRGGQGIVFQAVQRSTKRAVAIKVMKQGPFATLADRARFDREIETLGKLDHPNIVAVHDAGVVAGFHYFVMNYIDGTPLDEHIANCESRIADPEHNIAKFAASPLQFEIETLLRLFVSVCDAVHAAHLRGIVHRDLKPSNIRVDRTGQPHVLDFGLARPTDGPRDSAMTRTGQFVGSLPWAAPEQVEGAAAKIDFRTDVYSLGAILFQLLTGQLPFDVGSNLRDAFDNILRCEPPRPSTVASAAGFPRIDNELDTIVLKCLSKDRERRYQSAGELARDLRHYLADEPIDAKRDSAWYVLRKSARRHRHLIGLAAAGAFVLAAGLGAALYGALDARRARVREAHERTKATSEAAKSEAVTQVLRALVPTSELSYGPNYVRPAHAGLDRLVARLEGGMLGAQPQVEAAIHTMLGSIYRERGLLALADWEYREALRIQTIAWGAEHPEVALSLNNLADLLLERNGVPEAEHDCRRGLEIRRKLFGPVHRDVAQSLDTLARILLSKGELPAAEKAGQEALAIRLQGRGEADVDAAQSLDTLARVFTAQRDANRAAEYARRALSLRLRLLNDEHPAVAASLRTLADVAAVEPSLCLQSASELRELAAALGSSEPLADTEDTWQHLLQLKRALLGEQHPSVAQTLMALGTAQRSKRHLSDARETFNRALQIFRIANGPDDLTVAEALYHFCLASEGDCPAFVAAARERARIYERQLRGKNDMAIVVAYRELADYLGQCGDYAASEEQYRRAIDLARQLLGPVHRELAWCMSRYAETLLAAGGREEAEPLANESLRMLDSIDRSPSAPRSRMSLTLGRALLAAGRYEEAEPRLLEATAGMATFYPGRPEQRQAIEKVIELYGAWGRPDQASQWRSVLESIRPASP